MKNKCSNLVSICALLALGTGQLWAAPVVTNYTTAGDFTWVCPPDVTNVQIQTWGAGGAGGGKASGGATVNAGGGAGGAYAVSNSYTVTPGNSYFIHVGAGGVGVATAALGASGDYSGFSTSTPAVVCLAVGGGGGASGNPGAGGTCPAGSIGDVYLGGAGKSGVLNTSCGGGGGSGGTGSAGNAATSATGASAVTGGGPGGDGALANNNPGSAPVSGPGGGGGGARGGNTVAKSGGSGYAGKVTLTYTPVTYTVTYDLNGGDSGSQTDPSSPYAYSNTVTVLNQGSMVYTDNTFTGWTNGSGTAYVAGNTFSITNSQTFYAQWAAATSFITTVGTLSAFSTTYGTASAEQTFTVAGTGISGGILVTAPAGFEVSQTSGSGYNTNTTVTGDGEIAATTIYVRLPQTTGAGTYSGNVACTSTGAGDKNVAIPSSSVSQYALNLTGAATQSKIADGNTTATLTSGTLDATVNGDVITPVANFPQTNAGLGLTVTVTLTGAKAASYSLTLVSPSSLSADIYATPRWTSTASGTWDTAANWLVNTVATGSGVTADFSTLDITADTTVSLATARTIGTLIFGDTATGTAAGWIVDNNATPANTLTLAGTTPTINVGALGGTSTVTIGAVIAGTSGLTKTGNGTLVLTNANTYTGNTFINAGVLNITTNLALGDAANTSNAVSSGATLQLAGGVAVGSARTLSLAGTLESVSGDNQYGGVIQAVAGGAAKIQCDAGTLTLTNTIQRNTGSPNLSFAGAGSTVVNGPIASLGLASALTIDAPGGTVTFAGNNGLLGNLTLTAGTFNLNSSGAIGSDARNSFAINGGTIDNTSAGPVTESVTLNSGITIGGNFAFTGTKDLNLGTSTVNLGTATRTLTINGGTLTFGGAVTNTGGITKAGVGTLTLTGANTYTGDTTISAGTLQLGDGTSGHDGTIASSLNVTNNGALVYNRFGSSSYGGVISGSGTVSKSGAGTQTLTGVNTYTGATTVSNGTLLVSSPGSLAAASAATVESAATLGGDGTINGAVEVKSGGFLAPGNNAIGTLTFGASPTLAGTLAMEINKTGGVLTQDQLAMGVNNLAYAGVLTVTASGDALAGGDSFTLVTRSSGTLSGWFTNVTLPALTAGLTWDTNRLATNGVLDVYTFTTTPLALTTPMNSNAVITALKLANHASSSRGTPVAVSATTPTNGTASVTAGVLTYTPTTSYTGADSFTVTYNDGNGSQTMVVSVTVGSGNGSSPNIVYGPTQVGGNFVVRFAGIPGTTYTVETNSVASGPGWVKEVNITAPTDNSAGFGIGVFEISDPVSVGNLFYRTVYPAY